MPHVPCWSRASLDTPGVAQAKNHRAGPGSAATPVLTFLVATTRFSCGLSPWHLYAALHLCPCVASLCLCLHSLSDQDPPSNLRVIGLASNSPLCKHSHFLSYWGSWIWGHTSTNSPWENTGLILLPILSSFYFTISCKWNQILCLRFDVQLFPLNKTVKFVILCITLKWPFSFH